MPPWFFVPEATRPNSRVTPNILEHPCSAFEAEVVRQVQPTCVASSFVVAPVKPGLIRQLPDDCPYPPQEWPKPSLRGILLRKEVIQPLVPQRLPCYDFIPVTNRTLGVYLYC